MTKSNEKSIVSYVNWIHKNRNEMKELSVKAKSIEADISKLAAETCDAVDKLKKYMGAQTQMNIKIKNSYYALTQGGSGVDIDVLLIDIVSDEIT